MGVGRKESKVELKKQLKLERQSQQYLSKVACISQKLQDKSLLAVENQKDRAKKNSDLLNASQQAHRSNKKALSDARRRVNNLENQVFKLNRQIAEKEDELNLHKIQINMVNNANQKIMKVRTILIY